MTESIKIIMDQPPKSRPKVSVHEHRQLVDVRKSKKLAAFANKSANILPAKSKPAVISGLKSDFDTTLQQARILIDGRIHDILNSFPEGRRNKLFNLRFGSIAAIQALEIKAAFKKLAIDSHSLNIHLLASRNYHGDSV